MLKKIIKILGIACLALLLLFGGVALWLTLFFPADQIRAQIEKQVQKATGRECRVGSAGISIWRGFALDLKDLRIAALEGESAPCLLGVEDLYLKMKLLPLLRKRIEIVSLSIVAPELYLERDRNGELNLARKAAREEKPAEEPGEKMFSLILYSVSVERAMAHYLDRRDSLELALGPLDGRFVLLDRGPQDPLLVGSEVTLAGLKSPGSELFEKLAVVFPLRLNGTFRFDPDQGDLSCADLQLRLAGFELSGKTDLSGVGKDTLAYSLELQGGAGNLQELAGLLSAFVTKGVKIDAKGGELKLAASLRGSAPSESGPEYSLGLTLAGLQAQVEGFPRRIGVRLAQLRLTPGGLELEKVEAALGADTLKLSGRVALEQGNPFSLRLTAGLTLDDLPRFVPALAGWRTAGKLKAALDLKGELEKALAARAEGTLEGRALSFRPPDSLITYEFPRLSLRLAGDNLEDLKLQLSAGRSRLELSAAIRNYRAFLPAEFIGADKAADWDMRLQAAVLDVNDFYMRDSVTGELTGWMAESKSAEIPHSFGRGTLALHADTLIVSPVLGLRDAELSLTVRDSLVRLERIGGRAFAGRLNGTGRFSLTGRGLSAFRFDLGADSLSARALLTPFSSLGRSLDGLVRSDFHLLAESGDADKLLQNLSGTAEFSLTEGQIRGWPVLVSLANLTGIEELRDLVLDDWTGKFTIRDQRVYGENLRIGSPVSDLRFEGSSGFDGTLDYSLALVLSEALTRKYRGRMPGEISSLLTGNENRLELNLKIGGTTDQPKVSWDSRPVAERLTKKLGGQLNKLFDRLLPGSGKAAADSAAADSSVARGDSTAQPAAGDAAKKIPGLLKNLLKKKKKEPGA